MNTHVVSRLDVTSSGGRIPAGTADDRFLWSGGQLSGEGNWAVFTSAGGTIVPGDTNTAIDVFERGPRSEVALWHTGGCATKVRERLRGEGPRRLFA